MKRLVSSIFTIVVVIAVLVGFVVFSRHNGPGDSPRDTNNTKPASESAALHVGGAGVLVRL
jgi:hypothetical protein